MGCPSRLNKRVSERVRLCHRRENKSLLLVVLFIAFSTQLLLSIEVVTSQSLGTYYPTGYNLLDATAYISGALTDLQSDNSAYMTFRSYASQTSAKTLYAHQETTTIAGASYYLQRLESADTLGTSLSASMGLTGRQLWGRFVHPLSNVASIPASIWTINYRAWYLSTGTVLTNSPSSAPIGLWSNPTEAFTSDDTYADSNVPNAMQPYGNYGLLIPPLANIVKVEVGYEAYTDGDEKIGISVSWDYGLTWATEYVSPSLGPDDPNTLTWVDFTNATSWTAESLSDTNFLTRAKSVQVGAVMEKVFLDWIPVRVTYVILPSAHADVDILIRKSNGDIRKMIATNVANSGTLSTTAQTLSGTFSWSAYTVGDETDYLEIDYYVDVTTASDGATAYLRIDDGALPIADQTKATGIVLPSEYTMEVEFMGSSNTNYWSQLVWAVDSAWTAANVTVTLQLYNYTLGGYPTTGNGYISYTSNATPNTDETKNQTIRTNPFHFRDSLGNWKIKVKGVKSTSTRFDFKVDLIKLEAIGDITSPVWSNAGTNSTAPGRSTLFYVKWSDNVGLSGFIFGTNNTGTWKNDTWTSISGTNNWSNVTKTLNTTAGTVVQWRIWANDTSNNWNDTGMLSITTAKLPAALFTYSPSTPNTNETVNFDASASYDPDGTIVSYFWDFGDGNVTVVFNPTINHVYRASGSFNVTLTVFDNDGYNSSFSKILTVVVHNIAILSVSPSATEVKLGQQVNITVVVKNKGTTTETFNVTVYYNNAKLETQTVVNMAPDAETVLIFPWNTAGLDEGAIYTIRAETSEIQGETNTDDNNLIGGSVKISATSSTPRGFWDNAPPYAIPIGFTVAFFLLLTALTVLRKPIMQAIRPVEATSTQFDPLTYVMGGELPDAFSVVIVGDASAGKSILCQQLTFRYLNQGKPCVYVSYDCFPDEIRENMKSFGWEISPHEQHENFSFVDCYSSIAGKPSQEKYFVKQPFALSELGIVMSTAMSWLKQKSARVFLDSTAPLFTRLEPSKVIEFLQDRSAQIKGESGIFFFTVGRGIIQQDMLCRLEEIVDCIIDLEVREEKGQTIRKLRIKKLRGRKFSDQWVSFKIDMQKGFVLSVSKSQK